MVSEQRPASAAAAVPGTTIPGQPGTAARLPGSVRRAPFRLFETVTDLKSEAETLRKRRYGVIEVCDGRLCRIRLRPFPKLVSLYEVGAAFLLHGKRRARDRCLLYYNAPRGCPGYIALRYLVSDRATSVRSVHTALRTLDEIARLRHAIALVCDAANPRLSPRLMERYGWVRHCEHLRGRHYIKRYAQ